MNKIERLLVKNIEIETIHEDCYNYEFAMQDPTPFYIHDNINLAHEYKTEKRKLRYFYYRNNETKKITRIGLIWHPLVEKAIGIPLQMLEDILNKNEKLEESNTELKIKYTQLIKMSFILFMFYKLTLNLLKIIK